MAGWKFFKGCRDNWFSHNIYNWIDASEYPAADILHERCVPAVIRHTLEPFTDMFLEEIRFVPEGSWKERGKPLLDNVQAFYFVRIKEILSGVHIADLRVFLPMHWNGRFMGIAGAGTNMETDWDKEQTTNLTSWPMAVRNGFACVVCDGATGMFVDSGWGFKDGDLDWQLIRNWAFHGTHDMTVTAKAVVEACYGQKIYKSYMHGTSGGGRQIILEAEHYPDDYDGLWADGPLYDFYNLMFSCLWAAVVYYNEPHKVPLNRFKLAHKLARSSRKLRGIPYDLSEECWQDFVTGLPGTEIDDIDIITVEDVMVMMKVWNGPVLSDGKRVTYGFGPEIIQWPVGPRQFGYMKLHEDGTITQIPFAVQFLRWLVRDPLWDLKKCSYEEFEKIYLEHKEEFREFAFYEADLDRFASCGGKLMITHGTGDHVAPNQLTLDYYYKALRRCGDEEKLRDHLRVFFPEYGGHALYDWDGPNVTNASGLGALMQWVEKDLPPEQLQTINYDFEQDRLIRKSTVEAFKLFDGASG